MEASQEYLHQVLDETLELEDEIVEHLGMELSKEGLKQNYRLEKPFYDSLESQFFIQKYSDQTSELENKITAQLGHTNVTDMSAISDLQKKMREGIEKMEMAQAQVKYYHDPPAAQVPDRELEVLVKLTRELSELESNFYDESPPKQYSEQRIDPDLHDPEVIVQHRIACIRRLLFTYREEIMDLLEENTRADFRTLLDVKSNHVALFQREFGRVNRVYVGLVKNILAELAPRALKKIEDHTSHLQKFARPRTPDPPPPVVPDPLPVVPANPFVDWIQKDSALAPDSALASKDAKKLDFSGYGIGRFDDHGWEILAEELRRNTTTLTELDLR
jgi:hypothetical protein